MNTEDTGETKKRAFGLSLPTRKKKEQTDVEVVTVRESATTAPRNPAKLAGAAVLGLLAAWLGWSGYQAIATERQEAALTSARDGIVSAATAVDRAAEKQMAAALAAAPVQAALTGGDLATAGAQLKVAWPKADSAEIWPLDMATQYAALPQGGYGRLAAAEAALGSGKTALVLGKDTAPALFMGAPAKVGDTTVGVAVVRLPAAPVLDAVKNAQVGNGYLALRQGSATLLEAGDTALAERAESLAQPIPNTDLRVAAANPEGGTAPFGLGAIPALIAAGVCGLLALLLLVPRRRKVVVVEEEQVREDASILPAAGIVTPVAAAGTATAAAHVLPADAALSMAASVDDYAGMTLDPGIFRAYDIRGVLGTQLNPTVAEAIGHAIGTVMNEQGLHDIVVGRDGRLSGPELSQALITGLRRAGRNVIDIGLAPTPLTYFGSYFLQTGCCVSVTGSHNPPDYNGFKVVVGGETLSGPTITDLYQRIAARRLHTAAQPGTLAQRDISQDYVERIAGDIRLARPVKIVVDAGNGVAGDIGPRVLQAIGADVLCLYCDIDGTFPNHHPDPSELHNLQDLIHVVQREGAELGIAFDGDGDRLGVVTPGGESVFPDRLLMLFAEDMLERNPGAQVIYDVKCTGRLQRHIVLHGGSPLMWQTGHSLIKAKMRETGAELAGEMSGHFFFGERWYGFDDGIYAAARLLEIVAQRDETPAQVLDALPNGVSTPEIKVLAPAGNPHIFVERFRERAQFDPPAKRSTIDGLRVDWPDGWGLVRASNTTPVLVLRFDAETPEALARIQHAFREELLALDPDLALPF